MFEVLTKFLDSKIDYQTIFAFLGIYLVALWLMFCFWVFVDANKRYHKVLVAILMALLVFVFNFPALIFYLIVRPENDDFADFAGMDNAHGGVQVPIVNFTGQNGEVQMSLSLHIHPQKHAGSDMVIDVGWESNKSDMRLGHESRPTLAQQAKAENAPVAEDNLRKHWNKLREKAKGQIKQMQSTVSTTVAASVSTPAAEASEANTEAPKSEKEPETNKPESASTAEETKETEDKSDKKNKHHKHSES